MSANKPIQIFKPGRHTAMSGAGLEFSAADLAASAAAYDPAKHEAPIVVGHPALDAPAYGWIKGLAYADSALDAQPDQVDAAFAEMVAKGYFKKISASFYAPDAPGNPVPGVYYLRHVGFLGAAAPAVKGLRNPSFAADEAGVVEFSGWEDRTVARLFRQLREWFIGAHGQETADKVVGSWDVDALVEEAAREDTKTFPAPAFAASTTLEESPVTPVEAAALEAENKRLAALVADTAARDRAAAVASRHAAHVAFAEGLVGKLAPAQRDMAVALLDHLGGQEAVVEFGEGEAKQPLADAVKAFLQALPDQVDFADQATRDRAAGATDLTDPKAIAAKAVEFQEAEAKAGRVISISAAVTHVTAAK